MTRQWILGVLLTMFLLVNSGGCARGLHVQTVTYPWEDGMYIGVNETLPTTPFIQVEVDITWGRMVAISLLQHPVWKAPTATTGLVDLVLQSQTTAGLIPRGTGSEQEQLCPTVMPTVLMTSLTREVLMLTVIPPALLVPECLNPWSGPSAWHYAAGPVRQF